MTLPDQIPAMSLPDTVLLPMTAMPLRIFEDRYKEMLADSLATHRMFAIANRFSPENATSLSVADVATVGLIRMSSQNPDGTSMLLLEGTHRVRVDSIVRETPYPVLQVSYLPTTNHPNMLLEKEHCQRILEKIDRIHEMIGPDHEVSAEACRAIDDLETLAHFVMQNYCSSTKFMQDTLSTVDLQERCKLVEDYLELQITLLLDMEDEEEDFDDEEDEFNAEADYEEDFDEDPDDDFKDCPF